MGFCFEMGLSVCFPILGQEYYQISVLIMIRPDGQEEEGIPRRMGGWNKGWSFLLVSTRIFLAVQSGLAMFTDPKAQSQIKPDCGPEPGVGPTLAAPSDPGRKRAGKGAGGNGPTPEAGGVNAQGISVLLEPHLTKHSLL
jgi:hypothetical protein